MTYGQWSFREDVAETYIFSLAASSSGDHTEVCIVSSKSGITSAIPYLFSRKKATGERVASGYGKKYFRRHREHCLIEIAK